MFCKLSLKERNDEIIRNLCDNLAICCVKNRPGGLAEGDAGSGEVFLLFRITQNGVLFLGSL